MKKIETIDTVAKCVATMKADADEIQKGCKDYVIKDIAKNIKMTNYGTLKFDGEEMPLGDWALSQLGTKTGVPGQYLEKCINKGFGSLAADNVNTWLETMEKSNMLVRTYDGTVRGLLSSKYTICDAPSILENVDDSIDGDKWEIKGSYINEERMHLRLVSNEKMNIDGDNLFPAVFIDSSDVGRCAINVQFGMYRLACTNGLVIPQVRMMYHKRHIGEASTFMIELQKGLTYLPTMINNAEALVTKAKAAGVKLVTEEDVDSIVAKLKQYNISENDAKGCIQMTRDKYDGSRWGLVNGMTEFAQSKTLETRLAIEKAAGYMLAA